MPRLKSLAALAPLSTLAPRLATTTDSARLRGYSLQRERVALLRSHPLCSGPDSLCERDGIVREATERDHIVPLERGGAESSANTQALCRDCHRFKSARELLERLGGK